MGENTRLTTEEKALKINLTPDIYGALPRLELVKKSLLTFSKLEAVRARLRIHSRHMT